MNGTRDVQKRRHSLLLILCLLFMLPQISSAQDSSSRITATWLKLKGQFQKRNDIAITMLGRMTASSKNVKQEYLDARAAVKELSACIDTLQTPDGLSAARIHKKNDQLMAALSRALVMLENDPKLKSDNEVRALLMQLEASENRIYRMIREYNEACTSAGRPELSFREEETEEAPKVRF